MPLSLGWDADPEDEESPPESTVPGLLLSDIAAGATRPVTARWMHSLYKHIVDTKDPGTMLVYLREAGYTTRFSWPHALIIATFFLQLLVLPFAVAHGQQREAWLIVAGAVIRVFEGILAWMYPRYRAPRSTPDTPTPRYWALHTGMTTNHILVITHRFGRQGKRINLEDAAVPLRRKTEGVIHKLENPIRVVLKLSIWVQKGASLVTSANGYTIPLVLLSGTIVLEFISAAAGFLPIQAHFEILNTGSYVLDHLTAACQKTGSLSVGFVESLLPDPSGEHLDYHWIKEILSDKPGIHSYSRWNRPLTMITLRFISGTSR
ncbi:hypothetical protein DFH07DRAFT_1031089 [Mycena maculata]|uniref:Uncharacterized protein n=1 Tax=Mycena maculata TaxID=230809 RepID=A0AAD7NBA1_9AGAR|nr:hypothetical protein DFH07DRAFT_1031089 [Mycena maculata]